jgi:hypothetical protein
MPPFFLSFYYVLSRLEEKKKTRQRIFLFFFYFYYMFDEITPFDRQTLGIDVPLFVVLVRGWISLTSTTPLPLPVNHATTHDGFVMGYKYKRVGPILNSLISTVKIFPSFFPTLVNVRNIAFILP